MKETSNLLYKESKKSFAKRKRSKKLKISIYIGGSLIFLMLMAYFWLKGHLDLKFPSILLIPVFLIFWNIFSVFEYMQLKTMRPLRIYNRALIFPEPNFLSLKMIQFSEINKIIIDCNFAGIFMEIYRGDTSQSSKISNLDEEDVDRIYKIFEEKGILVENKI